MADAEVVDDAALLAEAGDAVAASGPGHAQVVGDGDEERTRIRVARPGDGVHFENGPARVIGVDRVAVVHDTFEDGQGADPHSCSLPPWRDRGVRMVFMADTADPAREYGVALADAVDAAIEGWVLAAVERAAGAAISPEMRAEAATAGGRARAEILPRLRELLARDVDDQTTTPLAVLRDLRRYPTEVLQTAGVAPASRDDDARARFPDDVYDIVPAAFADFGPEVAEAGLRWGAAKAFAHKARHGR